MPWGELGTRDRWLLVTAALQAMATIGTFLVAVVGFWKVTPIITYQVQQQQQQEARAEQVAARVAGESVTDRFSADAVNWWGAQVTSFQRILDLTGRNAPRDRKVGYELIPSAAGAIAPGVTPDLLVVTSTSAAGAKETLQVAVNEQAMSPSQYLQCRVNQGVFAALDVSKRAEVEVAVQSFVHRQMVPRVPPAYVRPGISLRDLHDQIALDQGQRVEALQRLLGMKEMLDAVMQGRVPRQAADAAPRAPTPGR